MAALSLQTLRTFTLAPSLGAPFALAGAEDDGVAGLEGAASANVTRLQVARFFERAGES